MLLQLPPRAPARAPRPGLDPAALRELDGLVRAAAFLLRAPAGAVTLGSDVEQHLVVEPGLDAPESHGWRRPEVEELCAGVAAADRAVVRTVSTGRSFAGVPVRVRDGTAGVLAVLGEDACGWTEEALTHLEALAGAVAAVLERQTESRLARWMRDPAVGFLATDAAGRIAEVSAGLARALDRAPGALLGMDLRDVVAREDHELVARMHARHPVVPGEGGEVELRVVRPSGERRLLRVWAFPVLDDDRVTGSCAVVRDVSEEHAREEQQRRAERMAAAAPLLSSVCHELNNPLTSIKSFAELLLLDDRPPEDREALEIVRREAHRAARIVTDLRLVAQQGAEAGIGHEVVKLDDLVRGVVRSQAGSMAGIRVRLDLADGLPPLRAVRARLEQLVLHLLFNAVQAMEDWSGPRELTVRCYPGGIGVVLEVDDTGPGIDPAALERIFDPFWTTRRTGQGAGLGLSLVHGIVTDHGGRIRVDSTIGRGSRFSVELPVVEDPAVSGDGAETNGNANRSLRILVADDEEAIRYSLTRYMERRGHRVDGAADGWAALALIDGGHPPYEVVVADLRMPGLNGSELLQRLRERSPGWNERVILISGDADSADLRGACDHSGIPVVQKPFELAEMALIIETQAGITGL